MAISMVCGEHPLFDAPQGLWLVVLWIAWGKKGKMNKYLPNFLFQFKYANKILYW